MKVLVFIVTAITFALAPLGVFAATDAASDPASREERIKKYVTSYPVKLSEKDQSEVAAVCVGAQQKLQDIYERTVTVAEERHTTYEVIDARLNAVQQRLFRQQISVLSVDNLLKSYRDHTAGFKSSLVAYQQTLQDATLMDCKANPGAFRSAVEAVRVARKAVADDSAAISQTLNTDMKSTFNSLKQQLAGGKK